MATQLTLVNNVLRRLREDEVTSVADNAYSKLIAQFINDAKADLEDVNYEWSVYVTEIDTTILADGSTVQYALSETNERSWLIRDHGDDRWPAAYDITTDEMMQLNDIAYKTLKKEQSLHSTTTTNNYPRDFAIVMDATGDGYSIEVVYPVPATATARSWRSYWYVPQADLALDGTDDATSILLPNRPIELLAVYYALNERGEEMGEPGGVAQSRAQTALAAALENDMQVMRKSEEVQIKRNESL